MGHYRVIAGDLEALAKVVRAVRAPHPRLPFVYEAGPGGFGIHRYLTAQGEDCVVVNPSSMPKRSGDRIKTDRRDGDALARLHRAGELTAIMVEIDPREGSGVIPNDWQAFLQPRGRAGVAVRGTMRPQVRAVKALAGVLRRNYDYDRFWVTFPLLQPTGSALFSASDLDAELVVRFYDKEGHVAWPIPSSLRESR